jgi:hypothetical protein
MGVAALDFGFFARGLFLDVAQLDGVVAIFLFGFALHNRAGSHFDNRDGHGFTFRREHLCHADFAA